MKKLLLLTTSALLLFAGCAKEEQGLSTLFDGEATTVTFTASMDDGTATKAAADGDGDAANVNRCIMEVYYGDELFTRMYSTVTDKKASFTTQLVANRTYTVAFWADSVATRSALETDLYYTTNADGGLQAIALKDPTKYIGNDDARDAFFAVKDDCTVAQAGTSFNITLNRPFAQVNVITTDWDKVTTVSSLKPDKVDVTIQNPLTKFNAVTGEASADASVTSLNYNADLYTAPAPVQPVSTTEKTLSMDYLFAAATKEVIDIAWKAQKTGDTDITHSFSNIPYQRNYRTNIKGALLTTTGQWNVTVDPVWESSQSGEEEYEYVVVGDIKSANEEIEKQIENGQSTISVKFTSQPNDAGTPGSASEGITCNSILTTGLPENVTLNILVEAETKDLYIGDYESATSTTVQTSGVNAAVVNVNVPQGSSIRKLVINAPSKTIYINGIEVNNAGTITDLDAITSDNTLIISKDQTVTNLTVRQGALEIHGTVGTATVTVAEGKHVYVRDCEGLSQSVYDVLKQCIDADNGYIGEQEEGKETYRIYKNEANAVAKIGDVKYYTLKKAFEDALAGQGGQTIELLKSCSLTSTITIDKTVTLDLNTYTLTAGCSGYLFNLNTAAEGKTFKITGTDADNCGHIVSNGTSGHKGIAAINGSAITFEMDYVKVHGETEEDAYVGTANANQEALLNDYTSASDIIKLNDCTISTTSVILGGDQEHSAAASLNISGGSYTGAKGFRYAGTEKSLVDGATITSNQGIAFYPYSTTDLINSTIIMEYTGTNDAVSVGGKGSVLTITNTTISTKSKTAVAAEHLGLAVIESGTFKCTTNSDGYAVFRTNTSGGEVRVNGGTVDASKTQYAAFANTYSKSEPDDPSGVVFNGGTITGGTQGFAKVSSDNATVEINGGTYTTAVKLVEGNTQWVRINDNAAATFNEKVTSESIVTIPAGTFKKAIANGDLASGSTISGGTFYEAAPYSGYIKSGYEAKAQGTDPETWKIVEKEPEVINVNTLTELNDYLTTNLETPGKYVYQLPAAASGFGSGTISINQRQYVSITIQGVAGSTTLNQVKIEIAGHGRNGEDAIETVTIKNIAFDFSGASSAGDIIASVVGTEPVDKGHTHNVTIEGCTFTGSTTCDIEAVRDNTGVDGWKSLTIKDCQGTNLHALAQLNKVLGCTISGCTLTGCKGGVNLTQSQNITICDNTGGWNVKTYVIRAGQSSGGNANNSYLKIYGNKFDKTTSEDTGCLVLRSDCPTDIIYCDNDVTLCEGAKDVYDKANLKAATTINTDKSTITVDNQSSNLKIQQGTWDKSTKTFTPSN